MIETIEKVRGGGGGIKTERFQRPSGNLEEISPAVRGSQ